MSRILQSRCLPVAIAFVCAVFLTWPLAREDALLPIGQEPYATVPLFNAYTIWWNVQQAAQGWPNYWDAPFFYPGTGAFALSEPQPITASLLPVWWLTHSVVWMYRVWILASLTLNGIFGWRLLRACRVSSPVALAFLPLFVALPIVHWLMGVLQLVAVWGLLFSIERLIVLRRRPTVGNGVWLGVAYTVTWLHCAYYGLFLTLILSVAGVTAFHNRLWQRRTWVAAGAAWLTMMIAIGPFLWSHWEQIKAHGIDNPVERILAPPLWFLATPWRLPAEQRWAVGSGICVSLLAVCGCLAGWRSRCQRTRIATILTITVLGMVLAADFGPASWWLSHLPGFRSTRNQYRFAVFFQIGAVLLAALATDALVRLNLKSRSLTRVARRLTIVLLLVAYVEAIPLAGTFVDPPSKEAYQPLLDWIATLPDGEPLAFLPVSPSERVDDFLPATRWMFLQQWHRHPVINGYSANAPRVSVDLYAELRAGRVAALESVGVRWIIKEDKGLGRFVIQNRESGEVIIVDGPNRQ